MSLSSMVFGEVLSFLDSRWISEDSRREEMVHVPPGLLSLDRQGDFDLLFLCCC